MTEIIEEVIVAEEEVILYPSPHELGPVEISMLSTTQSEHTWGITKMNIPEAWKTTQGEDVVVAVFDSQLTLNHPDLIGQVIDYRNFTSEGGGALDYVDGLRDHGTPVVGIIAANGNGTGYVGVAPKCKVIFGKIGSGESGSASVLAMTEAFKWATAWRGPNGEQVKVINMSYATVDNNDLLNAFQKAIEAGISVVVAGGNDGDGNEITPEFSFLPVQPECISVAWLKEDETIETISNSNTGIDVAAPGDGIYTTSADGGYRLFSGTSCSAPHIAGIMALIHSAYEKAGQPLTSTKAQQVLYEFTRSIRGLTWNDPYQFVQQGHGMVDFNVKQLPKPNTLKPLPSMREFKHIPPYRADEPMFYIGAYEAWKKNRGEGVVVAVLSTGAEITHNSLQGQILDGKNFTADHDGDVNNYTNNNGLGIAVAGLIASKDGYVGVAPHSKIIAGKVMSSDGTFAIEDIVQGIDWAINWRGKNGEKVDVILTTAFVLTSVESAAGYPIFNALHRAMQAGIVDVSGTGDDSSISTTNKYVPGNHMNGEVLSVKATSITTNQTAEGDSVVSSAYSVTRTDLGAPGANVYGLKMNNTFGALAPRSSSHYSAALTAGALAIIISSYRQAGYEMDTTAKIRSQLQKYIRPKKSTKAPMFPSYDMGMGILDLSYSELPIPELTIPIVSEGTGTGTGTGTSLTKYIENGVPKVSTSRTSYKNKVANKFN